MPRAETVWIVMGGGIVICAYTGARAYDHARRHSRCVTGTDAIPLDLAQLSEAMRVLVYAELRTELSPDVVTDLEYSEWEETEDVTPVEMWEIDDRDDR